MAKERIHVYLSKETIHAVRAISPEPGEFSRVIEELLQLGLSLKNGEVIEQHSLPIIREIVQTELLKAHAQLRSDLRDDHKTEKQEISRGIKESEHRLGDRLAALIVRAIREGGISRRMLFTVLSKEDPELAMAAYEDAKAKVGKELVSRFTEAEA